MVRVLFVAALALGLYFPGSAIAAGGEKLYKEVCGVCHGEAEQMGINTFITLYRNSIFGYFYNVIGQFFREE